MPKRLKVTVADSAGAAPNLACYFPSGQQQQQQGPNFTVFETNTGRAKAYTVIGQRVCLTAAAAAAAESMHAGV
eukprot:974843-Pelagomonas_calceolata.AAC.2